MSFTNTQQASSLSIEKIRADFPTLDQHVSGHPLVYLDSAASTQKPNQVIDAIADYYRHDHSNVHRGIHTLSQRATDLFEGARNKVRQFINAGSLSEVIFTSGTTESINLVAQSYGRSVIQAGDEILLSVMEHHSNIVPWQLLAEQTGATIKVIPVNENGEILLDEFKSLLSERTKLLAITMLSNALGTITPLKEMIDAAHSVGAKVMVDAAQAMAHLTVDVQQLDCDFLAFSAHKVYGPTGTGVLYGKETLLDAMPPYKGGGEMIKIVSFTGTEFNELPHKFEAGTPNISGAIGMGTALDYVSELSLTDIAQHEHDLLEYGTQRMQEIEGLTLVGTASNKGSILSFKVSGVHAADIGTLLDQQGIAIRVGHHCAMPVMAYFGVDATARVSLGIYNTRSDIDAFINALNKCLTILR